MQERVGIIAGNPLIKWEDNQNQSGLVLVSQLHAFEHALTYAADTKRAGADVKIGLNVDHAGILRKEGFISETDHKGEAVSHSKIKERTTLSVLIPAIRDAYEEVVRDSGFDLADIRILSEGVARSTVPRWGSQSTLPGLYFRTAAQSCVEDACTDADVPARTRKPKVNCTGIAAAQAMNMARVLLTPSERKAIETTTPNDPNLAENGRLFAVYEEEGTRVSPDIQIKGLIVAYEMGLRFAADLIMMRGKQSSRTEFYFEEDDHTLIISPPEREIPMDNSSSTARISTMQK